MKKLILFTATTLVITSFFFSCGPAAENRQAMLDRAKIFQDSIANSIRSTIAEAESPAPMPIPANIATPTPSAPAK